MTKSGKILLWVNGNWKDNVGDIPISMIDGSHCGLDAIFLLQLLSCRFSIKWQYV